MMQWCLGYIINVVQTTVGETTRREQEIVDPIKDQKRGFSWGITLEEQFWKNMLMSIFHCYFLHHHIMKFMEMKIVNRFIAS